jgi:abortive infection bacteriophage resistance protein
MSLPYPKPALSYRQQAEQLMARGLAIADLDSALERLRHCNYYRLGAYWLPFEANHATHRFKTGATFEQVIRLYDADHALRLVVLEAIGQIEVSVRSQWAYQFGHSHGPHAHLERSLARNSTFWDENLFSLRIEVKRSREVFIRHLRATYQEELPPIWAACEVMTFGLFSRWYANTGPMQVKKQVAAAYGLSVPVLESWLRHLALVRNVCAHHARLWNREFTLTPEQPHRHPAEVASAFLPASRKLYNTLLILAHWSRYLPAAESWRTRLVHALGHPSLDPGAMDFPADGRYAALLPLAPRAATWEDPA